MEVVAKTAPINDSNNKKYIEKDFEEYYVPHLFEDVCRQYLIRKNRAGKVEPVKATGLNCYKYVFFPVVDFNVRRKKMFVLLNLMKYSLSRTSFTV